MTESTLSIRFWGVRGSIPSPGPDTVVVGGNTSCIEVRAGGSRIVLDAGSGLRALGDALLASGEHRDTTILLSHVHWDHVMGIPFFAPLYIPGTRIRFASGSHGAPLRDLLRRQMSAPMFPVDLDRVGAEITCTELADGQRATFGDLTVETARLNHPDPVYAYRLEHAGRSVVFATDTEHFACVDPTLKKLAAGADILIYDSQYTPEEYPSKVGWGHSTWLAGAELARAAGVPQLVLFHHDPNRTDDVLAEIEAKAADELPGTVAAREGMVLRARDAERAAAA